MDDKTRTYEQILEPLTGIVEDPHWDSPFIVPLEGRENTYTTLPALKTGIDEPPSYMVRTLFCGIAGFQWTNGDKSAWEIRVIFKGKRYRIWDHKRSSWSIGPINADKASRQETHQLVKKIRSAAKRLDKILESELATKVDLGNFYLFNSFRHIRRAYEHFREMVEQSQQELKVWRNTPPPWGEADPDREVNLPAGGTFSPASLLSSHFNRLLRLEEAVSHETVAMIGFFFSYVELLLDALFAFQPDREMSYLDFRHRTWDDRFKMVLPISTDRTLNGVYKPIRRLRKRIRDQMFHGLGGRPGLLVPFAPFGLVPISSENLKEHVQYSWSAVSAEESTEILETCAAFDKWIDEHDAAWYVHRFIELGVEIPFESDRVTEVRGWMTSREEFDSALEREAEHLDSLQDHY